MGLGGVPGVGKTQLRYCMVFQTCSFTFVINDGYFSPGFRPTWIKRFETPMSYR